MYTYSEHGKLDGKERAEVCLPVGIQHRSRRHGADNKTAVSADKRSEPCEAGYIRSKRSSRGSKRSNEERSRHREGGRDSINLTFPQSGTRRGRVGVDVVNTLDTSCEQGVAVVVEGNEVKEEHPGMYVELSNGAVVYAVWYPKYECYVAIRKLTPRECFRLQGWTDDYFEKAELVNSDSQLYKQAGNGVTVNVVEVIGKRLREIEEDDGR